MSANACKVCVCMSVGQSVIMHVCAPLCGYSTCTCVLRITREREGSVVCVYAA